MMIPKSPAESQTERAMQGEHRILETRNGVTLFARVLVDVRASGPASRSSFLRAALIETGPRLPSPGHRSLGGSFGRLPT